MRKHLALTGFMAAGKSTIGKKLARALDVPFYDLDERIVRDHGPIETIFYEEGESRFRRYEHDAAEALLDREPAGVLAVGGGADTHEPTHALLKKRTYRVFVKAAPEQIAARLHKSRVVRPLLGPSPPLSKIRDLYAERMPHYAHADYVIEAQGLTTTRIVEQIVQWMHKKKITL